MANLLKVMLGLIRRCAISVTLLDYHPVHLALLYSTVHTRSFVFFFSIACNLTVRLCQIVTKYKVVILHKGGSNIQ